MSLGRKKNKDVSAPKIVAPPRVTEAEYGLPTGDRYLSRQEGHRETTESLLSPMTRETVARGQQALVDLAGELSSPDARRMQEIHRRGQDFFDLQAQGIHADADARFAQTASDLSRRFGGSYNATFGTDLLGRLEMNRLNQLYAARKEAALYGEDLARADEDSRIRRFQLFQNYLGDLNNQARGHATMGATLLQNERNRDQDLAIMRAQLAQQAGRYNQQAELARGQQRVDLVKAYLNYNSQMAGNIL